MSAETRLRVVFMGTPDFAVPTLTALVGHPAFTLVAVVTQPDKPRGRGKKLAPSPVKAAALERNIPVLQPVRAREPETVARLTELAPDYLVVVAYGQILPKEILSIPRLAPVNLHASLLPRWRGAAPIHRAFLAGDAITGACAMVMEEGLDTGPTLLCEQTSITDADTVGALHDRMAVSGGALMVRALLAYRDGAIEPRPQNDADATYAAKLTPADFAVDWAAPAEVVSRTIRGLSPYPAAVTKLGGKTIKPLFARVTDGAGSPGEVLAVTRDGITVACGSGAVIVTSLKPEGKPIMSAHAFTLGHSLPPDSRFD
jgi:methionyl-tRNA formyltransferase